MICASEEFVIDCASEEFVIDEEAREQFARLLPELQQQISFRFRRLPAELCEDQTAEAVGLAFEMFVRLVQRGKSDLVYAGPLANYACRQVRGGRQCGSSLNVRDISSRHCQRGTGIRRRSLSPRDRVTAGWQELVVEDRSAGPADVAMIRIDFRDWLATLSRKKRQIAELLASGEATQGAAQRFQLSMSRISQLRRELMQSWNEFQGLTVPAIA